ncbi:hypothetical protein P7D22_00990 [Lichenihabitans sp. Uapishka_5]|uniref:hypothetical protein n=1 Tax=Lichenihabitans sp. Uapishka_5 TaxID=3037302 RepID=UPI0029E7E413|nr:hypothetical protein [Lichenihabitans sp. Uapishka_5]MDX7949751.1 hypothetical protein [Lichenihabitans sp. Uapishka_5]
MGDLKRMVGDEAVSVGESASANLVTPNPMDALNRRDIEIIKRSLVNMHKDNAELRGAIVALHGRGTAAPSRLFFVSLGVVMLIVVGAVTIARPQIDASLSKIPALARLSGSPITR